MKLGVAGLLPAWETIDETAAWRVRQAGFLGATIFIHRPLEADPAAVKRLRSILDAAGLETAQANGWYEALVNPDAGLRAEGVRGLQALVRIGRLLDAPTVYVRPGGLNPHGHWFGHPGNHTPETFARLVESLRQVCATAQAEGMLLAIEGHVLSVLDSARKVRELLDAVGSPVLKFNIDVVNFVGTVAQVHHSNQVVDEVIDVLGADTAAAHLKDCALQDELVVHIREVVAGTGVLDFAHLLRRLEATAPDMYCLVEHLPDDQVPLARKYIAGEAMRIGVKLES